MGDNEGIDSKSVDITVHTPWDTEPPLSPEVKGVIRDILGTEADDHDLDDIVTAILAGQVEPAFFPERLVAQLPDDLQGTLVGLAMISRWAELGLEMASPTEQTAAVLWFIGPLAARLMKLVEAEITAREMTGDALAARIKDEMA